MALVEAKGKEIVIKQVPMAIYSAFADLRNFARAIPQDKISSVTIDADSISGQVQGMNLGVRIYQRVPFSFIALKEDGASPFPFGICFFFEAEGYDSTRFHIEVSAELNFMMKMMLGTKLQGLVDQLTDQIEQSLTSGVMPDMETLKAQMDISANN